MKIIRTRIRTAFSVLLTAGLLTTGGTALADVSAFTPMTIDPITMTPVPDASAAYSDIAGFQDVLFTGLEAQAGTPDEYESNGSKALISAAAKVCDIAGPGLLDFGSPMSAPEISSMAVLTTGLAYLSEYYISTGAAADEPGAMLLVAEKALEYSTGIDTDLRSCTVDDLFVTVASHMVAGVDAQFGDTYSLDMFRSVESVSFRSGDVSKWFSDTADRMLNSVPEYYVVFLDMFIPGWSSMDTAAKKEAIVKFTYGFMNGCVNGKGTPDAPGTREEALYARQFVYSLAGMSLKTTHPAVAAAIAEDGKKPLSTLAAAVLAEFTGAGRSLTQASDEYLIKATDAAIDGIIRSGNYAEGSEQFNILSGCREVFRQYPGRLRRLVCGTLFYAPDGDLKIRNAVAKAATLAGNAALLDLAHLDTAYAEWLAAKSGVTEPVPSPEPVPSAPENPAAPEVPAAPENPAAPEVPVAPEAPDTSAAPADPEAPASPTAGQTADIAGDASPVPGLLIIFSAAAVTAYTAHRKTKTER